MFINTAYKLLFLLAFGVISFSCEKNNDNEIFEFSIHNPIPNRVDAFIEVEVNGLRRLGGTLRNPIDSILNVKQGDEIRILYKIFPGPIFAPYGNTTPTAFIDTTIIANKNNPKFDLHVPVHKFVGIDVINETDKDLRATIYCGNDLSHFIHLNTIIPKNASSVIGFYATKDVENCKPVRIRYWEQHNGGATNYIDDKIIWQNPPTTSSIDTGVAVFGYVLLD